MKQTVSDHGGNIDAIYFAPDHPDQATDRRKPGVGMLHEALAAFSAAPAVTPFIGDALRDIQAASAAGCPSICVRTGKGEAAIANGFANTTAPIACCDDLYAAAEYVIAHYAPSTVN